jgi:exonuclease III
MSAREIRRKSRRLGWFEKLRDGLQKGADIGWFVVVCGDEERAAPSLDVERTSEEDTDEEEQRTPRSAGLRGFFGTVGRRKNIPQE